MLQKCAYMKKSTPSHKFPRPKHSITCRSIAFCFIRMPVTCKFRHVLNANHVYNTDNI